MPDEEETQPRPATRSIWSGTLSFGLVSIPVTLAPAVREGRVSLRMLNSDGTPLARRYYCPEDNRDVHPEHLQRGYKIADEQYVIVRDEELEALAPEKSRDIDLRRFVKETEIDPIYFERPYYLLPDKESSKAYRLLAETMERLKMAGIATFVMHDHEYLVGILARDGILRAEIMRFNDEVRSPEDVGLPERGKPAEKDVSQAEKAIHGLAGTFRPTDFLDDYKKRLLALVERKEKAHQDVLETQVAGEPEGGRSVRDLMAALHESLSRAQASREKHGKSEAERRPAAGARRRRKPAERTRPDARPKRSARKARSRHR